MGRISVLIASALINASTIPGLAAAPRLNEGINAARAASATVSSKVDNAADNDNTCRAYAASSYELMLRQAAAGDVDGARMLTALDSVINAFKYLLATKCGS